MKKDQFQALPDWIKSNVFLSANLTDSYGAERDAKQVHPLDANLISSEKLTGRHILMLDLDQNSFVVDSSTTGHKHVYINANLEPEALKEIVDVLAKHGILQHGIKMQVEKEGYLSLRPPGNKKGTADDFPADKKPDMESHLTAFEKAIVEFKSQPVYYTF